MTRDEQLKAWLEGKSIHNDEMWLEIRDYQGNVVERQKIEGGECCPDFSCCNPKMLWPENVRRKFVEGDDEVRRQMFAMVLQQMAIEAGCDMRVMDDGPQTLQ